MGYSRYSLYWCYNPIKLVVIPNLVKQNLVNAEENVSVYTDLVVKLDIVIVTFGSQLVDIEHRFLVKGLEGYTEINS